jgi:hypothetical protein
VSIGVIGVGTWADIKLVQRQLFFSLNDNSKYRFFLPSLSREGRKNSIPFQAALSLVHYLQAPAYLYA